MSKVDLENSIWCKKHFQDLDSRIGGPLGFNDPCPGRVYDLEEDRPGKKPSQDHDLQENKL